MEMQLGESQTLTQPGSVAASQLSLPAALYESFSGGCAQLTGVLREEE